jgi:hypothetical protein
LRCGICSISSRSCYISCSPQKLKGPCRAGWGQASGGECYTNSWSWRGYYEIACAKRSRRTRCNSKWRPLSYMAVFRA